MKIRWLVVIVFALLIAAVSSSTSGDSDMQPRRTEDGQGLFTFIRTVQVTPDDHFSGGGFARINYVPATDRLVVTFAAKFTQPSGGCMDAGHGYKEYTLDMEETGNYGVFSCEVADLGSLMMDNTYYDVSMHAESGSPGWRITKYDAVSWQVLADTFLPLDLPREKDNDPTVAYVNGQLDISAQYDAAGPPPPLDVGAATHHYVFSTDLEPLGKRILSDTPHVVGSSMIIVDGITYFITADAFMGDVIVMQYDRDWNYLGMKELIKEAHWSTGVAFDGERFYLAYIDTRQRTDPDFLPVYLNVHLAAFDRDWNLLDDVAVTDYTPEDNMQTGRPWVILHGNRVYVSYDLDTRDPVTHEEQLKGQAVVSVYELNPAFVPSSIPTQSGQASDCRENELSPLGVLRSTDHGTTWTSLGNACIDSSVWAVDPTGFRIGDQIMLYFVDFDSLNQPVPQIIYRATSTDGVHFDQPQPAYTQTRTMVDHFVLPLADGSYRLYTPSDQEGIISAVSSDGLLFTREEGVRTNAGGMPGALLLPDNRVRLFLSGMNEGKPGIFSMISEDGLNFTFESGLRIESPPDIITDDPQPIRLADGTYLMAYQTHNKMYDGSGSPPWEHKEIHLATSTDGFNWTTNPGIIVYGGTSCIVETEDGTLYIYYVNR